jgi:hypothetical protein
MKGRLSIFNIYYRRKEFVFNNAAREINQEATRKCRLKMYKILYKIKINDQHLE